MLHDSPVTVGIKDIVKLMSHAQKL